MPKRVNHEDRRQLLALTVAQLISEQGLQAVTVRSVSAAAGFSTKLVTVYFPDMRSLLLYSYEEAARRSGLRFQEAIDRDPNDLRGAVSALLPMTPDSRRDWQVWFAFWGMAIGDPEFSRAQAVQLRKARELFQAALERATPTSALPASVKSLAKHLLTALIGIAIQGAHDPLDWNPSHQAAYLDEVFSMLRMHEGRLPQCPGSTGRPSKRRAGAGYPGSGWKCC